MSTNERKIFADQVSQLGSDIFQDPIGELTRKRQNYLLLASVAAILLSLTVIKPIEGDFSILKVTISNPDVITLLAGCITTYFVVVYGIGVFQDMAIYRYKQMKQWTLLNELSVQAVQVFLNVVRDDSYELAEKAVKEKYAARLEQLRAELEEFHRNTETRANENQPNVSYLEKLKRRLELSQKLQERVQQFQEQSGKLIDEQTKELTEIADRKSMALGIQRERIEQVRKVWREYNRLSKARLVVEILFPFCLAIVAIWQTLVPTAVRSSVADVLHLGLDQK